MMEFKSVGMIKFPTELKVIIQMFQSPPTRHCLAGSQAAKRHLAMELSLGKKNIGQLMGKISRLVLKVGYSKPQIP